MPKMITHDGSSIEYEVHGGGPTLLLIPGLGFGRWSWFKQIPALSRRFRVVTFDPRSPRDPKHGVAELAQDAAALLDRLSADRAHILGTSLGGFVAQELALTRPDLVDRLVLVSTSHGGRGGQGMSSRALATMFGLGSFSPEGAARRGLKMATSAAYRTRHPEEFDRIVSTRLALSPSLSSYLRQARAGADFDASRRVQNISAPTLVIHGSDDRYVPVSNAYALARAVPGAALRVFDGAGHLVFVEKADEVNTDVVSFLLGVQETHEVREVIRPGSAPEGRLKGWLLRVPQATGRWVRGLRDRLTR